MFRNPSSSHQVWLRRSYIRLSTGTDCSLGPGAAGPNLADRRASVGRRAVERQPAVLPVEGVVVVRAQGDARDPAVGAGAGGEARRSVEVDLTAAGGEGHREP